MSRDTSSGTLSYSSTSSVVVADQAVEGNFVGLELSSTRNKLFVAISDSNEKGGIAIFDLQVQDSFRVELFV